VLLLLKQSAPSVLAMSTGSRAPTRRSVKRTPFVASADVIAFNEPVPAVVVMADGLRLTE
jgi:hypothetical protein